MKPKTVFLDTSAYISEAFAFHNTSFQGLRNLCQRGSAHLLITDITKREIRSNAREFALKAKQALLKLEHRFQVLNLQGLDAFREVQDLISVPKIDVRLDKGLDEYLGSCRAEILHASDMSAAQIFRWYFDKDPPFGKERKKSEFPDAFVIYAISEWAAAHDENVYIISKDPDFDAACENNDRLIYFETLAPFVESALRTEGELVDRAIRLLEDKSSQIEAEIETGFDDIQFYLEDEDGFVEHAEITDLHFPGGGIVDVDESFAEVVSSVRIRFKAEVNYGHPSLSWYDEDERHRLYLERKSQKLEREQWVPVEFTLQYEPFELHNLRINRGAESVGVFVDEEALTHWK